MALPVFATMNPLAKVNLVTRMQVGNTSRFRGYTYLGLLPYQVALTMQGQNPYALVTATRSYFRDGAETDPDKVLFVAMRQDLNSPVILVPEPLIEAGSVEIGTRLVHTIRVEGAHERDELATILSSNGIIKFSIITETLS